MRQEENENPRNQPCLEFAERLVLFAARELGEAKRSEVEDHVAHCARCSAGLAEERRFLELMAEAEREEPDAALLASCRAVLVDALDQEEEKGLVSRWLEALMPSRWLAVHPALSAALLIAIGFSVGSMAPRLLHRPGGPVASTGSESETPVANSQASQPEPDLRAADVTGINWVSSSDNAPPQVVVQLKASRPMTLQGTVNNDEVKRALLNVLRNNQRFDPDVRLDSVELLKPRSNDPEVRNVLCQVVHTDRNAAVRLKALEALSGAEPKDLVRQTLLDALVDDANPGVRIEAINSLRTMAQSGLVESDPHMLEVLRERVQKDPSTYIRLQSAAAIRDLGPREKY
jgi:hypothetical protein